MSSDEMYEKICNEKDKRIDELINENNRLETLIKALYQDHKNDRFIIKELNECINELKGNSTMPGRFARTF